MPYKSAAQRAKFHADPKLRKYAPEFDAASKGMRLPRYAPKHNKRSRMIAEFLKRHGK